MSTLWVVGSLLRLCHGDLVYHPADFILGTSSFQIQIGAPCSGYEGIGLIWVFVGAYLWWFRRTLRFPQALLLLPVGTGLIWLANAVRIAALVLLGTWVSPAVALGGFHSQAGWLAFNAIGLGLVVASQRTRFFLVDRPRAPVARPDATAASLAPLLAIVATTMVVGAFSSGGFDRAYPLGVAAAAGALWFFRRDYAGPRWIPSGTAVAIGAVVFALWMAMEPIGSATEGGARALSEGLAALPWPWAAAWLVARAVGSAVVVPVAEELAFRGYLTRRLIAVDFEAVPAGRFTWTSFLVSSALFGALHGRWLAGTLAGMLYALAYYRRGRVADAILAHATTNALIAAYVLATGAWSLWI